MPHKTEVIFHTLKQCMFQKHLIEDDKFHRVLKKLLLLSVPFNVFVTTSLNCETFFIRTLHDTMA